MTFGKWLQRYIFAQNLSSQYFEGSDTNKRTLDYGIKELRTFNLILVAVHRVMHAVSWTSNFFKNVVYPEVLSQNLKAECFWKHWSPVVCTNFTCMFCLTPYTFTFTSDYHAAMNRVFGVRFKLILLYNPDIFLESLTCSIDTMGSWNLSTVRNARLDHLQRSVETHHSREVIDIDRGSCWYVPFVQVAHTLCIQYHYHA